MSKFLTLVLMIMFVLFLLIIGPIITIWAWNTLFPMVAVPYTIETWLAVIIMGAFFRANVSIKKDKD